MTHIYDDTETQSTYAWTPKMEDENIVIRISKSTLTNMKWCPQQLWLSKTLDVPQEKRNYLTIGDDVHNTVEEFYKRLSIEDVDLALACANKGQDKVALRTLRKALPSRKDVIGLRREENREDPFYDQDYEHNINWLMRYELNRLRGIEKPEDFYPVGNETRLSINTEIEVDGGGMVPVVLVGIIDRIFLDEEGGLTLFELKTGKWNDNKMSDMRMEMAYYKFLLENTPEEQLRELGLDKPVTHWGWRYSAADRWHWEKAKGASEKAMKNWLGKLIKSYLNESFETTKAEFKCTYCSYMEYCPRFGIYNMEALS